MKYALLIYVDPASYDGLSEDEVNAITAEYGEINQDPRVVGGDQLAPVDTATTVRVDNGESLLTDGPFADSKEFFGGYFLVEADDIDGPVELAGRVPAARMGGAVEVRPLVEM